MSERDLNPMVGVITPEIYQKFKEAVELRKWHNGVALTSEQVEICMQAMITYEYHNLPECERTGFIPPKTEACVDESHIHTHETPIKWQN